MRPRHRAPNCLQQRTPGRRSCLTLVSDVASDYFMLLNSTFSSKSRSETVKTQEDSVKLTHFRLEHGVATKLDVLQAQQVLDSANATDP